MFRVWKRDVQEIFQVLGLAPEKALEGGPPPPVLLPHGRSVQGDDGFDALGVDVEIRAETV